MGRHCGATHRQATHHAERVRTHQRTFASQLEAAVRIYLAVIIGTRYPRQPEGRYPREQVVVVTATLGYARVSTIGQDLDTQLAALSATGVEPQRVFTDALSGSANTARPGLAAMLDYAPRRHRRGVRDRSPRPKRC